MRKYKIESGGYITAIGTGPGGVEITEAEYNQILETIRNKPTAETGYDYRLTESLEWELVEVPVVDTSEEEISADEALSIILGGETA